MLVNRYDLLGVLNKRTVQTILKAIDEFPIKVVWLQIKTFDNKLVPIKHFDLIQAIEVYQNRADTHRSKAIVEASKRTVKRLTRLETT